jgi:hypothetical protein
VLLGILNYTVMMNKMAHVFTNAVALPHFGGLEHITADANRKCGSGSICNFTPSSTN